MPGKKKSTISNLRKKKPEGRKINSDTVQSKNSQTISLFKKIRPSGSKDLSFFEMVYEVARQIPFGRVTSYGAIAASLGAKSSARMVGWAMNGAHNENPAVPAHRVVNRVGLLSGKHHFQPREKMEELLKKEGVDVKDDQVIDFKKIFWDPSESGFD